MDAFLKQDLAALAAERAAQYASASPFPHIHLKDFFIPEFLQKVADEFPALAAEDAIKFDSPTQKKLAGKGEASLGKHAKQLVHYLNSQPFLEFLQTLTGIEETLLPDPYLEGGGLHQIEPGGYLKIHADFNKHKSTHLDRRLNLLVYLNQDWQESYGGHLELWDTEMQQCEVSILPVFNSVVVFSTTDNSYHGHPNPLTCPEGRTRQSLALYYYSNGRPAGESAWTDDRHTTLFQSRPGTSEGKEGYGLKDLVRDIVPPGIVRLIKGKPRS